MFVIVDMAMLNLAQEEYAIIRECFKACKYLKYVVCRNALHILRLYYYVYAYSS